MTETNGTIDMSRTARRAAANREAIVDAAEALLEEGGLAAVTVDAVAERADVAVQTVYNRVGRRPEVLVAVAERAVEENRRYLAPAFQSAGNPLQRITAVARAYIAFAVERPRQFELLNMPPDEPAAVEQISAKITEQVGLLAEILAAGAADGSLVCDVDPVVAATALWSMMEGILALGWRTDRNAIDDAASLHHVAEYGLATIMNGLTPR